MKNRNTKPKKPKNVSYRQVPDELWRKIKKHLSKVRQVGRGHPPTDNRRVLNGIWYALWTVYQWKSIERDWLGVSTSNKSICLISNIASESMNREMPVRSLANSNILLGVGSLKEH